MCRVDVDAVKGGAFSAAVWAVWVVFTPCCAGSAVPLAGGEEGAHHRALFFRRRSGRRDGEGSAVRRGNFHGFGAGEVSPRFAGDLAVRKGGFHYPLQKFTKTKRQVLERIDDAKAAIALLPLGPLAGVEGAQLLERSQAGEEEEVARVCARGHKERAR